MFTFPNFLTLCHLFMGCVAVVFAVEGHYIWAGSAIYVGLIFDFLDGWTARLLGSSSKIGVQLDSLADMITFSFAPSMFVYLYLMDKFGTQYSSVLIFVVVLCSALRLAVFNTLPPSPYFIGIPTPANAMFLCSLVFLDEFIEISYLTTLGIILLSAGSLILPIKMLSLKKINVTISILYAILLAFFLCLFVATNFFVAAGLLIPAYFIFSVVYFYLLDGR